MPMFRVEVTEKEVLTGFFEADNLEKAKELLNAVIDDGENVDRTDLPKWEMLSEDYWAKYDPDTLREVK